MNLWTIIFNFYRYFFNVLGALVVIGLFNGLMLLPVLLSIFGPKGEVCLFIFKYYVTVCLDCYKHVFKKC